MHRFRRLMPACIWIAMISVSTSALACEKPLGQHMSRFYDPDAFGRIGILDNMYDLSGHVHMVEAVGCYDLRFLRIPSLQIVFNSRLASGGSPEASYLGALVVRSFRTTNPDAPIDTFFFRNPPTRKSPSKWASPKDYSKLSTIERFADLPSSQIDVFGGPYSPKTSVQTQTFKELGGILQTAATQSDGPARIWHSMVVQPSGNGAEYSVRQNSSDTQRDWALGDFDKIRARSPNLYKVQTYLSKYDTSTSPSGDIFFEIVVAGAECVYLKLIGPQDTASNLIQRTGTVADFMSFRMKDVDCNPVTPVVGTN